MKTFKPQKGKIGGRKTSSLQIDESKPFSGVFVSSRGLAGASQSPPTSASSLASDASNSSNTSCTRMSWKSSGAKDHQRGAPLFVSSPDGGDNGINTAERLSMVMERARQLPRASYYSSNHVLVNEERSNRTIAPLIRMHGLDQIARIHAQQMADLGKVHHLDLDALRLALKMNHRRLGSNVQRGETIRKIHQKMMESSNSNKNNICDRRFTHMGCGTAVDSNGVLYLCQVFRG